MVHTPLETLETVGRYLPALISFVHYLTLFFNVSVLQDGPFRRLRRHRCDDESDDTRMEGEDTRMEGKRS